MTEQKKYSQNDEQLFILEYFGRNEGGKFIDIGAYDPFRFSNTRALFEKGWRGVLVEPQPENYKTIADHYQDERAIQVLNVAIGERSGEIDFYESGGDAVGTTDEDHMQKWKEGGVKYSKIKVQQLAVVDFADQYCRDADFISIDTEATNMVVFDNMPDYVWQQIKAVVIEHDNHQHEIERKLATFGFTTLYTNAENILLAKV